MNTPTDAKSYSFNCIFCGQDFWVTQTEADAHGWTSFTVQHLACTVAPAPSQDLFDWSQATDAATREMMAQAEGRENVSR